MRRAVAMLVLALFLIGTMTGCSSKPDKDKEAQKESEQRLKVTRPWNC